MKKKLKKQKLRLFITIASSLLALSIVVFSIFTVIIYSIEKELMFKDAYFSATEKTDFASMYISNREINGFYLYEIMDPELRLQGKGVQIQIQDSNSKDVLATNNNAISVAFTNSDKLEVYGCIFFDEFKSSMTEDQYETITNYLLQKPDEEGQSYELICTKFYEYNGSIYPQVVEVVLTEEDNVWYAQDVVIEEFELLPIFNSAASYHKIAEDHRNVIDTDFVFGKYKTENLIEQAENQLKNNVGEKYYESVYGNSLFNTDDPFTYIYYYKDTISTSQSEEDGLLTTTHNYNITYAEKLSVLESCMDKILMILVYIVIIFIAVGLIVTAIIWSTLRKQIELENRLRTVTNAMAHELKTPLFIIGGYSENLAENINNSKRVHYAKVITEQTVSMNELVSKMLDYSKLDSASFSLKIENFSITQLTREIMEGYMIYEIKFDCQNDVYINADRRLIKCVIENLIDNAVKYTTDVSEVTVSLTEKSFSVSNPCEPVTKEDIDNMWQPYHRDAEHNKIKGHGLGLAIVKNILELHKFRHNASYGDNKITFKFYY